jgi:signal transduction histidine kinase
MTELAQIVEAWPLAASMAAVVTVQGLRAGRRRGALNEALHELRRPLQAIALAVGPGGAAPGGIEGSLQLAATALERLEREINGGAPEAAWGTVPLRPLLEAAVARWRARASLAGGSLELRWEAGPGLVSGDRCGLAQALDNLIVNAIEHGGPSIVVAARRRGERLRVCVADSGTAVRRARTVGALARLSGRRRHGHGLAVVRRVASAHGGRFSLGRSERGSQAVLELPLAAGRAGSGA